VLALLIVVALDTKSFAYQIDMQKVPNRRI